MLQRRNFLKSSLCGGVSLLTLPSLSATIGHADQPHAGDGPKYELSRDIPTKLFDGQNWEEAAKG